MVVAYIFDVLSNHKYRRRVVDKLDAIHILLFSAEQRIQKSNARIFYENLSCGIKVGDGGQSIEYYGKDVDVVLDLMESQNGSLISDK